MQRLYKEITLLQRQIVSTFDGQVQVEVTEDDYSNIMLYINIICKDGAYANGKFTFIASNFSGYPDVCPVVRCSTQIYHPNIAFLADGGDICLNILDEWQPSMRLEDLVQALLFLLHNPNYDDAYNWMVQGSHMHHESVRASLLGEQHNINPGCYEYECLPDFPLNLYNVHTFDPLTEEEIQLYRDGLLDHFNTLMKPTDAVSATLDDAVHACDETRPLREYEQMETAMYALSVVDASLATLIEPSPEVVMRPLGMNDIVVSNTTTIAGDYASNDDDGMDVTSAAMTTDINVSSHATKRAAAILHPTNNSRSI